MILLAVLGFIFIIIGVQFRRGKWYALVAGNTFKDKPSNIQKEGANKASLFLFFIGIFFIAFYILDLLSINSRTLLFLFVALTMIYSIYSIIKTIKNYIKFGC